MSSFVFALLGTLFTFLMTALGAAAVFLMRRGVSARMQRLCLGFAGGVMSAASVFSLILPAKAQLEASGGAAWLVITLGFALGAVVIALLDWMLARFRRARPQDDAARRRTLLFTAVTLHNIPEGMAVGLAFALAGGSAAAVAAACVLALGIGVQNLPEGAAISMPLRQSGMSRVRSFLLGAASGAVEPLAGMLVVLFAALIAPSMPFLMAFAAGAMMLVTFSEMLPASAGHRDGAGAAAVGYVLMMAMDLLFS